MKKKHIEVSKFLSFVLRHKPEHIGIELDSNGWVNLDDLLEGCEKKGKVFTKSLIEEVVSTNDKKRFVISNDNMRIRANQGHSVKVDLELEPQTPPEFLYHGTVDRFLESIGKHGLAKKERQHVHLSKDIETAMKVGDRRGKAVLLRVKSGLMHQEGCKFYLSANGVWLADKVPAEYIEFDWNK